MTNEYEVVSLADAFPKEQARVRELLTRYKEIGSAGMFGATMIENLLQRADVAAAEQDTVAMFRTYEEMKNVE